MAKRGYKLQEFVAHSTNVNCLSIGKKACRLFITGGDDNKVNVWAIGKPTSLMSLCGHASPVESVAFDTAEVLVLAGASSGVIKLWDLEESKMVRTLTGHKSNCTAVEFHPFGEFFASGSMDTNLRIWDIRKKGCIHTYKGHTQGISTIRFTPDGRWVVSGGFDNVVKVWDLTAGKLLHDFKYHEGHIRSIDFHPLEFLLATGSADRTVKFWDLETFELIGSSRPEATGVRSICFHPDGRTLFGGLDDSLKVYSWEPVIYHDAVDMGWSTLGDLCIHEGKLMGCSYYRNSVGVWVADISLIKPYGDDFAPEENERTEQKFKLPPTSSEKLGSGVLSISNLRSKSPDFDTKEIKNIYVDSTGRNPVTSHKRTSPRVSPPLDGKKIHNQVTEKRSEANTKASGNTLDKSFIVPTVVPRDSSTEKESSNFGMGTISFSRTRPGMLLRPAHLQRPSNSKIDVEELVVATESGSFCKDKETALTPKMPCLTVSGDDKKSSEEEGSNAKTVAEMFEKALSPDPPSNQGSCDSSLRVSDGIACIKIVNGVAVVAGRTRTLVERFERRKKKFNDGDQATDVSPHAVPVTYKSPSASSNISPNSIPEIDAEPSIIANINPIVMQEPDETRTVSSRIIPCAPTVMDTSVTPAKPMACSNTPDMDRTQPITRSTVPDMDRTQPITPPTVPDLVRTRPITPTTVPDLVRTRPITPTTVPDLVRTRPITRSPVPDLDRTRPIACNTVPDIDRTPALATTRTHRASSGRERMRHTSSIVMPPRVIREMDRTPAVPQKEEPQSSGRDMNSDSFKDVTEDVTQGHDVFLSTIKSRLTKLQMIRHFWERSDIKGAINAMRRLPDPSVKADVVSVIAEKMDILNLDLFSCLLPVLISLLDCNVERYASLSMEMLLKLVAVFGPVIRSTISAPPPVGVDLHAEERIEWCNRCSIELQKIQQVLPVIISKGGTLAKSAQELNLVLQVS